MSARVALLRGINVGGTGKLPMAALKAHMEALGAGNVATYIQSGNAVFTGGDAEFAADLRARIAAEEGFAPEVMVLSGAALVAAYDGFPFPEALERPKFGNIWFCESAPDTPDLEALAAIAAPSETFALEGACFYLDAPEGIGRSKLAARVERSLGVHATARNLNTVAKLVEMVGAVES